MSFGGTSNDMAAQERPKLLGVDSEVLSTAEHGRPVPFIAGHRRPGVTFISEPWDFRSEEIKMEVGKDEQTVGFNYFCSFAGIVCLGLVSQLDGIYLDDQLIWEGPLERGVDEDFVDISIEGRGLVRFYWGTETQEADADLNASGVEHPGYRGQCYFVALGFLLGRDRNSLGNLQFEVRAYPSATWQTFGANIGDDAHPLSVFANLWGNVRCGLGMSPGVLDQDAINAAGATVVSDGIGVSPLLNDATAWREFLTELLGHIDAHLTLTDDGLVGIGLVRSMTGAEPVIDEDDLVAPPDVEDGGWGEVVDEVAVRFDNADKSWQGDSVSYVNRSAYAVLGATRVEALQRPWVTDPDVATKIAAAYAARKGAPIAKASLKVLRAAGDALTPGTAFYLSYAASGVVNLPMRVEGWTLDRPDADTVSIQAVEDRGHLNEAWATITADPLPDRNEQTVEATEWQAAFELPYAATGSREPTALFLAVRKGTAANGFGVWWEREAGAFSQVLSSSRFSLRGHLTNAYPETSWLDDSMALDVTLDSDDATLPEVSEVEALSANRMLAIIGTEILSVWGATLMAAGRYTLKAARGRYGTPRQAHADDAEVFIIQQIDMTPMPVWKVPNPPAEHTFKVQPRLFYYRLPLALCNEIDMTLIQRAQRPAAPANLMANGDGWCPTWSTGQDVEFSWTQTSEERCITDATLAAPCRADRVLVDVLSGGAVVGSWTFDDPVGPVTLTNIQLVAALGSEKTFELRAWFQAGQFVSENYDSITVSFV